MSSSSSLVRSSRPQARRQPPPFTRALPAYLGGKRRLAPLILALLAEFRPRSTWSELRLLDAFAGGCGLALHAKAMGLEVIASDVATRSVITARALIANSSARITTADVLDLFAPAPAGTSAVASAYVGTDFTAEQAKFVDRAIARAQLRAEPTRSLLMLTIIKVMLGFQPMSVMNATDVTAAVQGDYDHISPRRLGHYLRVGRRLTPAAVQQVAADVNAGVFGGRGEARQGDALAIIASTRTDILYLDTPYPGTSGYSEAYGLLDAILGDDDLRAPPPTLDALLAAATDIPLVVISFGGPQVTLAGLAALVARHRPVRRALAIPYPHLPSLASARKNQENHEFLVIAGH